MAEVLDYLRYLRDFTRKILMRRGFENVLRETARAPHCYFAVDSWAANGRQWSAAVRGHLQSRDGTGRGLFMGWGLVVGRVERRGRRHKIAAPVWFSPVELDEDGGGVGWSIPDWDQFQFNYDLLTLLLGGDEPDEEAGEGGILQAQGSISQGDLELLAELEVESGNMLATEAGQRRVVADNEVHRAIFEKLRRGSGTVRSTVKIASTVFSLGQLPQLLEQDGLTFFPHRFFFAAAVPSDLSTYAAQKQLVRQIEDEGGEVRNDLLQRILDGVLHARQVPLRDEVLERPYLETVVDLLPISLSDPQREAVIRAWTGDLSYIQGPPGTGKSHTITAMLLAGLLLGKRVLLVSHKRAALTVVREKITPWIGADIVYLGEETDARQAVKNFLQAVAQRAHRRPTQPIQEIPDSLVRLNRQRAEWWRKVAAGVDARRLHALAHEDFVRERDRFLADYPLESRFDFTRVATHHDEGKFKTALSLVERLVGEEKIERGGCLTRGQLLIVTSWIAELRRCFNADPRQAKPTLEVAVYARRLENLVRKYQAAVAGEKRVGADLRQVRLAAANAEEQFTQEATTHLRKCYETRIHQRGSDELIERFQRLFRARNPHAVAELIAQVDYDQLLDCFPIWAGEMRHLGNYLPFVPEMFDLVVVDEASQVNIAEILPAFYRGKRFCVVGDKRQLGLNAAGLFTVNRSFEKLIWNQHCPNVFFDTADQRALVASKHSSLDFVTHEGVGFRLFPTVLREHYRSLPPLALFTNNEFYKQDGGLDIMTETPGNILAVPCFEFKETGGQRDEETKVVAEEVSYLKKLMRSLVYEEAYLNVAPWNQLGFTASRKPSLGILVFLTNQRAAVREALEELIPDADVWAEFNLMVGTPEEFQGNERDIMFVLLSLDGTSRWGKSHYEQERRFNVATSRAIKFTYVIAGGIPANAGRIKRYLRHFGRSWAALTADEAQAGGPVPIARYDWRFSRSRVESEFEHRVADYLENFCEKHSEVKLFNQVPAGKGIPVCGEKRLDFVLYHSVNKRAVAVEVDGLHHYENRGKTYSEEHLERVGALKRAGWRIVHVPYYEWYHHGWLCDREDGGFQQTVIDPLMARLQQEMDV